MARPDRRFQAHEAQGPKYSVVWGIIAMLSLAGIIIYVLSSGPYPA